MAKVMLIYRNRTDYINFLIDGERVEDEGLDLVYVGSTINAKVSSTRKVNGIKKCCDKSWNNQNIHITLKFKLQVTAFAIAGYGSEL